ncbi:phosphoribosylamine--glycine ligase, partial [Corynebacterium tuscaniense]
MRILVIGSGGREHALLTALSRTSSGEHDLHVAPGNAGMHATRHDVAVDDPAAVTALAREIAADLVVIGPEQPLVSGVAD